MTPAELTDTIAPLSPDPIHALVIESLLAMRDSSAEEAGPDASAKTLAWTARALFATGQDRAARRQLDLALATGPTDADTMALASVVRPDGARWCRDRMAQGVPGERADAACDLAWLALRAGDVAGAVHAIQQAVTAVPMHAEAERWNRFLADAGQNAPRAIRIAGPSSGRRPIDRDVDDLVPLPHWGMYSPERALRRLGSGCWPVGGPADESAPARSTNGPSGLDALAAAGRLSRILGTDRDFTRIPADHPLVRAEIEADRIRSLEGEGRPACDAAAALWQAVATIDAVAVHDAAGLLVGLGIRDPSCLPVAIAASDVLTAIEPRPLWRSYRARLLAEAGRKSEARELARALLVEPLDDDVTWTLAVEALRRLGCHAEARRGVRRRAKDPRHAPAASAMLARWDSCQPMLPFMTDRVRDRFP